MSTLLTSVEEDSSSNDAGVHDDVAELLVDCHEFVEAALCNRSGEPIRLDGRLLLERLSLYVDWQTVH